MIQNQAGGDPAQQAAEQLPDQIDHEQHADILNRFGIAEGATSTACPAVLAPPVVRRGGRGRVPPAPSA